MAVVDAGDPAPRFSLPLLVVVGLAAVVLVAFGASLLISAQRAAEETAEGPVSYRHTYRLFGALAAALLLAFALRGFAVPSDYGVEGPFRAGARTDAARVSEPRYQGAAACVECHAEVQTATAKDVHRTVQCEVCHGPGAAHDAKPKEARMVVDRSAAGCLVCHRKLAARSASFPQVSLPEHFQLVGAKDQGVACVTCHDPHEPIYLQKPLAEARLHPLVHRCRDCHVNRTDETLERPAAHPAIFECSYCHGELAEDMKSRRHEKVACGSCHLFVKESDFAGRIVKNADPRFCLLCHGAGEHRREDAAAATIDWEEHRKTFDDTLPASAPCTTCHADVIHGERKEAPP
jgi:hypothetical protein